MNKYLETAINVSFPVWGCKLCKVIKTAEALKTKKENEYWAKLGIENIKDNKDWENAKDAA